MSRFGAPSRVPGAPRTRRARIVGVIGIALLIGSTTACSRSAGAGVSGSQRAASDPSTTLAFDIARYAGIEATIDGSGSTFQQNYDHAAIAALKAVIPGLTISYAGGGSGQGKSDLADGVVDFAGTDSLVDRGDVTSPDASVLYFPTVVSPITVSFNLPGVDRLNLDGPTLARIFSAQLTTWSDRAVEELNPGVALPSTPITVCHRSDASGTTTNFTRFLDSAGGADWPLGAGDAVAWPAATQGASGNGGVAQCIKGKAGAVGYVDLSDAKSQHLSFASIRNRAGEDVQPTLEGAAAAAASAHVAPDLTFDPIDTDGRGAYPITSPTWVIVSADPHARTNDAGVLALLDFMLTDGQDPSFTASVNYAPLPAALVAKARAQLDELRTP